MSDQRSEPSADRAPDLDQVEVWIFDLDNTLYSSRHNLFAQIDRRMGEFIADYLAIEVAEAKLLQKQYFHRHGTTLRGLMNEHGMNPDAFLDYVHDIDLDPIPPNARLKDALSRLEGRKLIFTNATREHAERVTRHLEIDQFFEAVFDIVDSDYLPKPERRPYEKLLAQYEVRPERAAMVEDIARNLAPAASLGMTTALVPNPNAWAGAGSDEAHIHHLVDDLADWLLAVVDRVPARRG
ncbi:MAG: pyrimidine 5'-nucleotidase [Alphaproteobacteria bacterium]|nr:pyrimidine 5'-nucleotidase [Alphaproteobacteria bacterium]